MLKQLMTLAIAALFSTYNFAEPSIRLLKWSDLRPTDKLREIKIVLPDNYESNLVTKQVITDASVIKALDGLHVRIPGYLVPITLDERQQANEFLLVPYLGACIHVPPPPPNQIVYIKSKMSISYEDTINPYWVSGVLHVTSINNELAEAGYLLDGASLSPYMTEE